MITNQRHIREIIARVGKRYQYPATLSSAVTKRDTKEQLYRFLHHGDLWRSFKESLKQHRFRGGTLRIVRKIRIIKGIKKYTRKYEEAQKVTR